MSHPPKSITQRMATSSGWLMLDRIVRMGLGFAVSILIARHYGPTEWGMLSYVLASATLFGSVATAGGEDIILRDLSQTKSDQAMANIQKTVFILRILFGSIAYVGLLLVVGVSQGIGVLFYMALIYGILFVFQASEIWEYRLRIEHRIYVIAYTHISTSLVSTLLKVCCVLFGLPLVCVTATMSGEYAANMGILASYKARHWTNWVGQFDKDYAKKLLSRSLLMMLSGFLIAFQVRCEYYLIDYYLGIESLGIYAAAFKCMELFDIMVVIFSMILVPELAKKQPSEFPVLASRIYLLGLLFFIAMLFPILLVYLIFPWVYGAQYLAAQDLLLWLSLRPLLILMGSIRSMFLVIEGRVRYVPICAFVGLLTSLGLGWFLIPSYGLLGAAISGLGSLFISNFVMDIFFRPQNIRHMVGAAGQWRYVRDKALHLLELRKSRN